MLLNEILSVLKHAAKLRRLGISKWSQGLIDEVIDNGKWVETHRFRGREVTIEVEGYSVREYSRNPQDLYLTMNFKVDGSFTKDTVNDSESGMQVALFALHETIETGARIMEEITPHQLDIVAEVMAVDAQAERRVKLYDRLLKSVEPDIKKLGYQLSRTKIDWGNDTDDHTIVWKLVRVLDPDRRHPAVRRRNQ